jgi:hypothetical protein
MTQLVEHLLTPVLQKKKVKGMGVCEALSSIHCPEKKKKKEEKREKMGRLSKVTKTVNPVSHPEYLITVPLSFE